MGWRLDDDYIDQRLQEWAGDLIGAWSMVIAPWKRERITGTIWDGEPPSRERFLEMDDLVSRLSRPEQRFIAAIYPRQNRSIHDYAIKVGCVATTVYLALHKVHVELARMMDQRRRGEEIDPNRRPIRSKAIRVPGIEGSKRPIASVVV